MVRNDFNFYGLSGDIEARDKGSLIAHENGVATPFGITGAQSRGVMMVSPKDDIYRDMIVGLHQRPGDLRVNICKVRPVLRGRWVFVPTVVAHVQKF